MSDYPGMSDPPNKRYTVEFRPSALKALKKLPRQAQIRIAIALEALEQEPRPPAAIKLKGAGADKRSSATFYRIRIGDYRVIYLLEDARLLVLVTKVAHRREAYR